MIASQYKITLPSDYNMNIIKKRVKENGTKTNGFYGLKFKFYLISEKGKYNNTSNIYAPLYIWNNSDGLNKFLFEGAYDNIINSFGFQNVNVGIPLIEQINFDTSTTSHIAETSYYIDATKNLNNLKDIILEKIKFKNISFTVIYNPDKWKYTVFYYISKETDLTNFQKENYIIYNVLHVSQNNI